MPNAKAAAFHLVFALFFRAAAFASPGHPLFAVRAVDDATGRGVPLVELRTTNEVSWWTDSNGYVAFDEPGYFGGKVWFTIRSDGYEVAADGFGYRGIAFEIEDGKEVEVRMHRTMIAERLYRLTGGGIYRDSVLLGKPVPTAQPVLNGRVAGQDSVQYALYRGKIHWFWGDTGRPEYPLGNFASSGATSELPANGGLSPDKGLNYSYFVNEAGFCRGMVKDSREGMKWIDGMMVLPDNEGTERLVARCERMKSLGERLGRALIVYDDAQDAFVPLKDLDVNAPLVPGGHPFRHMVGETEYFYFDNPFPNVRVAATWEGIQDLSNYEAFTCLAPGAQYNADAPAIERDAAGKPVWAWKHATAPLTPQQQGEMVKKGLLKTEETMACMVDAETGKEVLAWGGTTNWNEYRQRWIAVFYQLYGTSMAGEIWYAESEKPEGPWRNARKIITHAKHSFYNPVHHPFFDEEGGRVIYLEGTYCETFSDAIPTPRYNYNQIMYRLDLADERLRSE